MTTQQHNHQSSINNYKFDYCNLVIDYLRQLIIGNASRTVKFCLFIVYCLLVIGPSLAHANESSLTASPAILEKITEPGKLTTSIINVTNNTDFPLPVKGQTNAFISNVEYAKSAIQTFNSAAWFTLDPADFILQPRETKEIKVSIKPPKKTEPGGHYATIYFEPMIPQEVISPSSTISLARIGILTFLVVPGDIQEGLKVSDFTTKALITSKPASLHFSLKNIGNIHLLPTAKIEIKDIFGNVIANLNLAPSAILPSTAVDHTLTWDHPPLFGRMTANLTTNYGTNHDPITTGPIIFWIFPWPLILIIIVLLTLFYKIFIVHIDRIKLAIKVLKGKDVKESQNSTQSPRLQSRPHRRTDSTHANPKRSQRR